MPWASLPLSLEDIERIEVVRGPNSASFGSNAFLGIINIITKHASVVGGHAVSAQTGEQGVRGAFYRYGGATNDLRYRITVSEQRRDRFHTQPEQTVTRHVDTRFDYRLSPTDELTASFSLSRGDWRQGAIPNSGYSNTVRSLDTGAEHLQLKFRRALDPENEWSLQFYHTRVRKIDDFVVATPFGSVPVDYGYTQWRENIEYQRIARVSDALRWVWGAEARWEGVTSSGYFYNQDARTGALYRLFGNAEWRPAPNWVVHAGAMAEHHYLSGFDVSPRLAVNYRLAPDHLLRVSITQAYRSPTFFEEDGDQRFFTVDGTQRDRVFAPASDLKPERILSREVGYVAHVRPWKLKLDARLFNDHIRSVIGTRDIGDDTPSAAYPKLFVATNQHSVDVRGADLQMRWAPQPWLNFHAGYARVDIDALKQDIRYSAPKHSGSLLGIVKFGAGWEASVGVYRSGSMYWLGDGDVTQAFTRVDSRLARRWTWQGYAMEAAIVGQNLGRDYEEFRDTNVFSQRVYGSLGITW